MKATHWFLFSLLFLAVQATLWDKSDWSKALKAEGREIERVRFLPTELSKADFEVEATAEPLLNIPLNAAHVGRCLYKASNKGLWSPAFRADKDKEKHANTENRMDMLAWIHIEKKHIYFQMPKCASSSIKAQLSSYGYTPITNVEQLPAGFNLRDYFSFTFVREPLLRLNAAYGTIVSRHNPQAADFRQFMVDLLGNNQTYFASHHALPQAFFTTDENGLPYHIDFVGRLEYFAPHWKELERTIGVPMPAKSLNVAEGNPYFLDWFLAHATMKEKHSICAFYLTDYLCFGYRLPEFCGQLNGFDNFRTWAATSYTLSI